jgi:hypothetical protein
MSDKNPIYDFLKANNLIDGKDEATFLDEYSDTAKAKELHDFFKANNLTDKSFDDFYSEYLKKKRHIWCPGFFKSFAKWLSRWFSGRRTV